MVKLEEQVSIDPRKNYQKAKIIQQKVRKSMFKDFKDSKNDDENSELGSLEDRSEPEKNQIFSPKKPQVIKSKTLFIFTPDNTFRILATKLIENKFYRLLNLALIIIASARVIMQKPLLDPQSDSYNQIQGLYIGLIVLFFLNIFIQTLAQGLYQGKNSFLQQSPYNILNFILTLLDIYIFASQQYNTATNAISGLRILEFIPLGSKINKELHYAQVALLNAFAQMAQLILFCFIMFIVYGVFGLKLLKGKFYYCSNVDPALVVEIHDKYSCMDYGGSWVNNRFGFDTIFESVCILFITATTEGWFFLLQQCWSGVAVDRTPIESHNRWFAVYFDVFFYMGNLCMLNMFIGLIVNTYTQAKLEAQNLHLLDENQREWYYIKESIYKMQPKVKSTKPKGRLRQISFFIVKNKTLKSFWLALILLNTIILSIHSHRQSDEQKQALNALNIIFVSAFIFEILNRVIAKEWHLYYKDIPNLIDLSCIWVSIINFSIRDEPDISIYFRKFLNAFSVALQLTRNYRLIKRFNNLEKLFHSIFSVIPSALSMMFLMVIFLFIFTNIGIDMFAYLKPQTYINGWDIHFKHFTTAAFSLIRVASAEQWYRLLDDATHTLSPDFACIDINTYDEFREHGFMGCGTKLAYLYFISFHLIFSLVILNLFIASLLGAYEEHAKSEKSAISKYQLNDIIDLWVKFDPEGNGYIHYKNFWRLSSQIAIIFGIDQSQMLNIDNKKNFLRVLNIPIYEQIDTNLLCYKFHDVIISLTQVSVTLKYGVSNLEPSDNELKEKIQIQLMHEQKKERKTTFKPTPFNSGDMVAIILIQRKFRVWRKTHNAPNQEKLAEISDIGRLLKFQKSQKQIEIEK